MIKKKIKWGIRKGWEKEGENGGKLFRLKPPQYILWGV